MNGKGSNFDMRVGRASPRAVRWLELWAARGDARPTSHRKVLRRWFCRALAVVALFFTFNLFAGDLSSDFDAANKLYEQGHYSEAVDAYNKLLGAGNTSEAVYFNLGNAEFKRGQIGRAILAYRQAERLAPRDRALLANLQLARTRARGGAPYHGDRWHVWLASLSINEWTFLTCLAVWGFFAVLVLGEWCAELKERLRNYLFISGGAAICFGLCLGILLNVDYFTSSAIVTVGEADVRNGPLDESPGIFKVRDGVELEVVDKKDTWFQVIDTAQRVGWVRQSDVILFAPRRSRVSM